jgi:hypothetical protein
MRLVVVSALVAGCGRLAFEDRRLDDSAGLDGTKADGVVGPPLDSNGDASAIVCGEAVCQPVAGSYNSHFTMLGCTGTESYYTPYFSGTTMPNPDHKIYSWDGGGFAGTIYRTVTNRSYKDKNGTCTNAWPNGNTLDYFVTIYR